MGRANQIWNSIVKALTSQRATIVLAWAAYVVYVATAVGMSFTCGILDALPRYSLALFPLFIVLGKLRRWPMIWHVYLITGAMLQACLIIHYVSFRLPAP